MSILVVGGAGYIGSHTCVELVNVGYEVIIADNFCNSSIEVIKRVERITGCSIKCYDMDIRDYDEVNRLFDENSIDAVINFAGLKAVGESVQKPLEYYDNNLIGTIKLCEVMRNHSVKKLIFSSSATVYGNTENVPISENCPIGEVTNPYGRTKVFIEDILRDLCIADKEWSVVLLRYFNPIGAHKSGLIGESPKGLPNNLIPYIAQVANGKLDRLKVFGDDYLTKDGTGVRDYIHVVDLAEGHVKSVEKVGSSKGISVYNLGTGKGYSVLEVIKMFEKVTKSSIPYDVVDRRKGDVAISYCDATRAKIELGWEAKRGLREMCEDSWNWEQKRDKVEDMR